jgi:hypothetical protein
MNRVDAEAARGAPGLRGIEAPHTDDAGAPLDDLGRVRVAEGDTALLVQEGEAPRPLALVLDMNVRAALAARPVAAGADVGDSHGCHAVKRRTGA